MAQTHIPRALPKLPQAAYALTSALQSHALPGLFPRGYFTPHIPAISAWFIPPSKSSRVWTLSPHFLDNCPSILVSVEVTHQKQQEQQSKFTQNQLPLPLFLAYLSQPRQPTSSLPSLYLAQYPLHLLSPLASFTPPPPPLFASSSKGSTPSPTLWLGTSTTATSPLHRDPLANIFVHLAGHKTLRLFSPEAGERILTRLLGAQVAKRRIRGEEMMAGEERERVDEYVWKSSGAENEDEAGYTATVGSGDGVFIPAGWWHAVRAVPEVHEETGLEGVCASVNWWF